jgi:hypothetical protein
MSNMNRVQLALYRHRHPLHARRAFDLPAGRTPLAGLGATIRERSRAVFYPGRFVLPPVPRRVPLVLSHLLRMLRRLTTQPAFSPP